jgi:hypothetical protein
MICEVLKTILPNLSFESSESSSSTGSSASKLVAAT